MWYKLKRFFWCLFLTTNDPYNKSIDNIFYILTELLPKFDLKYTSGFKIMLYSYTSNSGVIFWNENKYYSWLSNGVFFKNNRIVYKWNSYRPSKKTMYEFKEEIELLDFKVVPNFYISNIKSKLIRPTSYKEKLSKKDVINSFSELYKYKMIKEKIEKCLK